MAETCLAVSKSTQKRCGNKPPPGADLCEFHTARLEESGELLTVAGVVEHADEEAALSPSPSPAPEQGPASWAIPAAPAIEDEAAATPPPPPAGEAPADEWVTEGSTLGDVAEAAGYGIGLAIAVGPWTADHGAMFLEATLDRKFRADGKGPLSPASLQRGGDAVAQLLNHYAAMVNPNSPWGAISFWMLMEVAPRYGGDLVARVRPGRAASAAPEAAVQAPAAAPVAEGGWARRVVG